MSSKPSLPVNPTEQVIYNLLHSKRFRSALVGGITIIVVNLIPALQAKSDLVSILIAVFVGLLITGYTLTDAQSDSAGRAMTANDALNVALSELVAAVFGSGDPKPVTATVHDTSTDRKVSVTITPNQYIGPDGEGDGSVTTTVGPGGTSGKGIRGEVSPGATSGT